MSLTLPPTSSHKGRGSEEPATLKLNGRCNVGFTILPFTPTHVYVGAPLAGVQPRFRPRRCIWIPARGIPTNTKITQNWIYLCSVTLIDSPGKGRGDKGGRSFISQIKKRRPWKQGRRFLLGGKRQDEAPFYTDKFSSYYVLKKHLLGCLCSDLAYRRFVNKNGLRLALPCRKRPVFTAP